MAGLDTGAVVQPVAGRTPTLQDINAYLRDHLSGYELPKALTLVDDIPRHVTGKANYPAAKEIAFAARNTS